MLVIYREDRMWQKRKWRTLYLLFSPWCEGDAEIVSFFGGIFLFTLGVCFFVCSFTLNLFLLSSLAQNWGREEGKWSKKKKQKKQILYYETLAQLAQRNCGCPLPGSVQGQARRGFEQPGLVEGVPAHGKGVGSRWSLRSLPTQTILWKTEDVL